MSSTRRPPVPPIDPTSARARANTEEAIDHAVTVAGCEVTRALRAEGLLPVRATARDILRSRYPSDIFDDEAITEPMSEPPFAAAARSAPAHPPGAARALETPSLSPVAVPTSAARASPRRALVRAPWPAQPAASRARSHPPRRFAAYVRSAAWLLLLMVLGAIAGLATVLVVRAPSRSASPPPRAATSLPPSPPATPTQDAGELPATPPAAPGAVAPP